MAEQQQLLPLHQAIKTSNLAQITHLLSLPSTNIHQEDVTGVTPLIEACILGDESIVTLLLDAGCPAQPPNDGFRHSPLRGATVCGHYHLIPLLLQHGADPNALSEGNRTPLMGACFLRQGSLCNEDEEKERSVKCVMALLVDDRVDPAVRNSFSGSALDLAKNRGYTESAVLVEKALDKWTKRQS
eukprot:g1699.t1 g1699   contig10:2606211-2606768(+)